MGPSPTSSPEVRPPERLAISMSGCGFLGSYHFGAATCFGRHGTQMLQRVVRFSGCSAGSLVAALCVLCPHKLGEGLKVLFRTADEVHALPFGALTPGFAIGNHLKAIVIDFLPEDISIANGRLFVSMTRQRDNANLVVSNFANRGELIQHLLASCHIPFYSANAEPPNIDGEAYIDGSWSNNLPRFDDIRTITISPFSGEADISPRDLSMFTGTAFDWKLKFANQEMKVNMKNIVRGAQALFPPKTAVLQKYFDLGYKDAMKFLLDEGWFERSEGTTV